MLIYQLQVGIGPDVHEMYVVCEDYVPHERIVDLVLAKLADYSPQIMNIKSLSPLMYCMGGHCDGDCGGHGACPFKVPVGLSDRRARILNMFAAVQPTGHRAS